MAFGSDWTSNFSCSSPTGVPCCWGAVNLQGAACAARNVALQNFLYWLHMEPGKFHSFKRASMLQADLGKVFTIRHILHDWNLCTAKTSHPKWSAPVGSRVIKLDSIATSAVWSHCEVYGHGTSTRLWPCSPTAGRCDAWQGGLWEKPVRTSGSVNQNRVKWLMYVDDLLMYSSGFWVSELPLEAALRKGTL